MASEVASRFGSLTGLDSLPVCQLSLSAADRLLEELQRHPAAAPATQLQQQEQEEAELLEAGSSAHWLEGTGGATASVSFSLPATSRQPSIAPSEHQRKPPAAAATPEKRAVDVMQQQAEVFRLAAFAQQSPRLPAEPGIGVHAVQRFDVSFQDPQRATQEQQMLHRSLAATLQPPEGGLHRAPPTSAAASAAGGAEPLEEIECKLLLHYFRPVFIKLFDIVQASHLHHTEQGVRRGTPPSSLAP